MRYRQSIPINISVPFAKGTALLRCCTGRGPTRNILFQSPSRRGRHFYEAPAYVVASGYLNFSPLREGDGTSTYFETVTRSTNNTYFSPPSRRGRHFYVAAPAVIIGLLYFSPLREGDGTSYQNFTADGTDPGSRNFSPLREGDGTSTVGPARLDGRFTISVPFATGITRQLLHKSYTIKDLSHLTC